MTYIYSSVIYFIECLSQVLTHNKHTIHFYLALWPNLSSRPNYPHQCLWLIPLCSSPGARSCNMTNILHSTAEIFCRPPWNYRWHKYLLGVDEDGNKHRLQPSLGFGKCCSGHRALEPYLCGWSERFLPTDTWLVGYRVGSPFAET